MKNLAVILSILIYMFSHDANAGATGSLYVAKSGGHTITYESNNTWTMQNHRKMYIDGEVVKEVTVFQMGGDTYIIKKHGKTFTFIVDQGVFTTDVSLLIDNKSVGFVQKY